MTTVATTTVAAPQTSINGLAALESTPTGQQLQRDTWDLLGSLALTLRPRLCKQMLVKSYADSFFGHEAIGCLASLRFIRSPNSEDPFNVMPRRIITLKLDSQDAKALLQNFADARLIRDSADPYVPTMPVFLKSGVYSFTYKGLRIIQEFIDNNALQDEADHLVAALATLPMPRPVFVRIQRVPNTKDELLITQNIIYSLFRSMCGTAPNYGTLLNAKGVRLLDRGPRYGLLYPYFKKSPTPFNGLISSIDTTHCIKVYIMVHWLLAFTTLNGAADAVRIGAEFARHGLIILIKAGKGDAASHTFTAKGPVSSLNPAITGEAHFIYTPETTYAITDEGRRVARWNTQLKGPEGPIEEINPAQKKYDEIFNKPLNEQQTANVTRLTAWMKQPRMRSAFGAFLSRDDIGYLLPFWLDVEDFRTMCNNTADLPAELAQMVPELPAVGSSRMAEEHAATERVLREQSHEPLSNRPFLIYNSYLASTSSYNLRHIIGDDLVKETDTLLGEILEIVTSKAMVADINPFHESTALDVGHLQVISELYGRIQDRVFRIMVLEYVPSFLKSEQFFHLSRT